MTAEVTTPKPARRTVSSVVDSAMSRLIREWSDWTKHEPLLKRIALTVRSAIARDRAEARDAVRALREEWVTGRAALAKARAGNADSTMWKRDNEMAAGIEALDDAIRRLGGRP